MAEKIGDKGEFFHGYTGILQMKSGKREKEPDFLIPSSHGYKFFSDGYFIIRNRMYYNDEPYEEGWKYSESFVWCRNREYPVFIGSYDIIESYRPGIWVAKLETLYHKLFPPEPTISKPQPILNERETKIIESSSENELRGKWGLK